ncbi:hypothetical protein [Rubellimicrobium aerolatum]|uniref:Uncharacterized protein n=1 Tax=Rubellimicrobium aerolatum TaxID=490979 RepID=A0ABW0SCG4_9RHOB|nr:hypothetical protein [Rubellimicrobium aerolatum]MBP1806306.1 drug/metabolite transporter (DMT)-like permease [Rubellimicrobium aerolatum]
MRIAYILAALLALAGAVLGGRAYIAPDSGVDGTLGAGLALAGAVAVTLGALVAAIPEIRGGWRGLLGTLLVLGAALTALAAWFLMKPAFAILMALALLGVVVALLVRPRRRLA